MSKKLSKVLVVAVVLVLAMSVFGLVACGGPEPLEGKTAMATLQKGFDKANGKAVENIKLGGVDIDIVGLANLKIANADIALVRTYNAEGVMNIDAKISNVQASLEGTVVSILKGTGLVGNFDEKVVENFKNVVLEANVDIEGDTSKVTVKKFVIKGLDKVVDAKGAQWSILKDGGDENGENRQPLGAVYEPGEIKGTTVDPRHKKDPNKDGDQEGLFTAMDKYSTNKAGTILETFIAENYKMLSLYEFTDVTVEKDTIKSNGVADLSKVYDLGNQVLAGYKDRQLKEGDPKSTLSKILTSVFGTDDVKSIVESIVDLGTSKINMTAGLKADGDSWKLASLKANQTLKVTLSKDTLKKAVDKVLPIFNINLKELGVPQSVIDAVLKADITTNITVAIDSTYEY